ncbi:diguanylate cyclase [Paraglaciecola sp.]|uniref:GGDEF domain-containing protein n=1 Tax=Paraglaciecola sp. TaxID=1920173 RepID=UPI0030F4641F
MSLPLTPVVKARRISLIRVFSLTASAIMTLFLLLCWLIYTSLLDFKAMFNDVAVHSLPDIVISSQLYGQSSRLLEATEQLSKSNSEVAKRLAEERISQYLHYLKGISQKRFQNEFIDLQLHNISLEIGEFSTLIKQKLLINQQLKEKESAINKLHTMALALEPQLQTDIQIMANYQWSLQLSRTVTSVNRSLNMDRLQEVRQLFRQFNTDVVLLREYAKRGEHQNQKLKLTNNLAQLILQDEGLLPLKILQLRIDGRVIGRENFVHNLIQDFARLLEFSAIETEQKVTKQLAKTINRTTTETTLIGLVLAGAIVLLVAMILFIQKHVIIRLQSLNNLVKSKINGDEISAKIRGNDEITDLANTFNLFSQTIEEQQVKLEHMSLSDGLTGIANRRSLDIRLLHDIELSIRKKSHVAILLMDIDCFKLYNDNYGHAAGDECLKIIATCIKSALKRSSDFVARYGGEEFVCVLPDTNLAGAKDIAMDIMRSVEEAKVLHHYSTVTDYITLSTGIAVSGPDLVLLPDKLLDKADKALYVAKDNGKNQFCSEQ